LLGDQEPLTVGAAVDADLHTVRYHATFVDNGIAHSTTFADLHVRQNDRALDARTLVDAHTREQHGLAHDGPGDDAATGDHGVDRHTAPAILIENELRRRLLLLVGPDGPVLVVDVQLGPDGDQLEVGIVERIDGSDVPPVALRASLHVLERVRKHLQAAD